MGVRKEDARGTGDERRFESEQLIEAEAPRGMESGERGLFFPRRRESRRQRL